MRYDEIILYIRFIRRTQTSPPLKLFHPCTDEMLYCVTSKHRQHSHLFESSFCQKALHVNLSLKYRDGHEPGLCPVLNCQMKMLYMLVSFCLHVQTMCLTSHLGCSMIIVCHDSLQGNCSIIISISIHPSILVFGADAAFTEAFQC